MITKTAIREFSGKIIGWIETDSVTGNQTLRDFYGKILGKYDKKYDVTRDFYGRIVAQGNNIQLLLNLK